MNISHFCPQTDDYDEMEFGIDDDDDVQAYLDEYLSELQHLKRT